MKTLTRACVGVVLMSLGLVTHQRTPAWASELTIFAAAVVTSPDKPRPHINYGRALARDLECELARREFVAAYQLAFDPRRSAYQRQFSQAVSQTNLAHVFMRLGKTDAALDSLDRVLMEFPLFPQARFNRAAVYAALGDCLKAHDDFLIAKHVIADLVEPPCSGS